MKTRKYETLLIARPEFEKEQLQDLVKRLQERIERNQGRLLEVSDWGLRKLAYPIRLRGEKFYYGRYLLLTYAGNGKAVKELEDYMKLIDDTFRFNSYMVSEEVTPIEQAEPVWREELVPEIRLRDDGEGLEVVEPSKQRKVTREEMYRPRADEKPAKEEVAEPQEAGAVPAAPAEAQEPGPESAGAESVGPESVGPESTGAESAGAESAGPVEAGGEKSEEKPEVAEDGKLK